MYIKKFWENVSEDWRHFSSGKNKMNEKKKVYIIKNVNNHLLDKLNFDEIDNSLDWGCGGGILSKELGKKSNVSIVDITKTSLENAQKYLGDGGYVYSQEIPNNINEFDFEGPSIDLIFCHAVIQHFPTIEYFNDVLIKWKKLNPKYIAIQVKLGDETKEADNYEKDFLNGLFFEENDLINRFKDINYTIISSGYSKTLNGKIKLGYYVFEKK